jgi:CDP-diacylglycerol---glycerol-3-phosphate 3-phosphatidyltransferase
MANLITLARTVLLFITVAFIYLSLPQDGEPGSVAWAVVGAVLTFVVFIGDALDGMVARARGETSPAGAVFDIAGDRVVENVYWVVFAHIGILPVWFALIMIARSFLVDGLRALALTEGKTPFGEKTMMTSSLGVWLAASRFHRALFGAAKVVTFIWLCLYLAAEAAVRSDPAGTTGIAGLPEFMRVTGVALATFTLFYSLVRGAVVVWDSRHMLGLPTIQFGESPPAPPTTQLPQTPGESTETAEANRR